MLDSFELKTFFFLIFTFIELYFHLKFLLYMNFLRLVSIAKQITLTYTALLSQHRRISHLLISGNKLRNLAQVMRKSDLLNAATLTQKTKNCYLSSVAHTKTAR